MDECSTNLEEIKMAAQKAVFSFAVNGGNRAIYVDRTTGRLKVSVEAGALSTVTTVTSLSQMGGQAIDQALYNRVQRSAWAANVRSRIS